MGFYSILWKATGFLQGFIGFRVDCEDADEGFSVLAGSRVVAMP